MNNILCVGFGGMGCRHTQSLLSHVPALNFFVLEPNDEIFHANSLRIGATTGQLTHLKSLDEVTMPIDFAIIATSAEPRFELMKSLLHKGIKNFLVEKVVFQSAEQFKIIISLLEDYKAVAYCNFVKRYFPNYMEIKAHLNAHVPLSMIVSGGDFGLACNALHYVDLFAYLTGEDVYLSDSSIVENEAGNKRGHMYKEITGELCWTTLSGSQLLISSDKTRVGGNEIVIVQGQIKDVLNEETLMHLTFSPNHSLGHQPFQLLYTSFLTKIIYEDFLKGQIRLPTIQEAENMHVQFFAVINKAFGLGATDNCPIT